MHKLKDNIVHYVLVAILVIWSIMILYPFAWLLINSFKSTGEILDSPWGLPRIVMFKNYNILIKNPEFFIYFKNTVVVTSISLVILIITSSLLAFAVARLRFRGNAFIFGIFIAGILLPSNASIIPLYVLMKNLHLTNNILALTLPYVAGSLPEAVFILVTFMRSLPRELEESCIIDGGKLFTMYSRIIFPLSTAGIITISIFEGLGYWNQFLFPLLFTSSQASMTLSIGIKMFVSKEYQDFGATFAGIMISIIPTVIFYSILSDRIAKGMVLGALKG